MIANGLHYEQGDHKRENKFTTNRTQPYLQCVLYVVDRIMGVKKIARPINQAKNDFVKWLKKHNATDLDVYEGKTDPDEWDYYRTVDAFIGETLYSVSFKMWQREISIDYCDEENRYNRMSIEEFRQLID